MGILIMFGNTSTSQVGFSGDIWGFDLIEWGLMGLLIIGFNDWETWGRIGFKGDLVCFYGICVIQWYLMEF